MLVPADTSLADSCASADGQSFGFIIKTGEHAVDVVLPWLSGYLNPYITEIGTEPIGVLSQFSLFPSICYALQDDD